MHRTSRVTGALAGDGHTAGPSTSATAMATGCRVEPDVNAPGSPQPTNVSLLRAKGILPALLSSPLVLAALALCQAAVAVVLALAVGIGQLAYGGAPPFEIVGVVSSAAAVLELLERLAFVLVALALAGLLSREAPVTTRVVVWAGVSILAASVLLRLGILPHGRLSASVAGVVTGAWMLVANAVLWRDGRLPRRLAAIGVLVGVAAVGHFVAHQAEAAALRVATDSQNIIRIYALLYGADASFVAAMTERALVAIWGFLLWEFLRSKVILVRDLRTGAA